MCAGTSSGDKSAADAEAGEPCDTTPLISSKPRRAGPVAWVIDLQSRLPAHTLSSIFVTHHLLKGLVAGGGDEGLIGKPIEFLLGEQHVPAGQMQSLIQLGAVSPWILKPLFGALFDTVPIFGYRRRPWMAIVTLIAIPAVACLGTGIASTSHQIVIALFFCSLQVAACTLLVDARRSEVAKAQHGAGPELVTFTEVGMNAGIICSALIVGPLIAHAGPEVPYFVALAFVGLPLLLVFGDWLNDERLPEGERKPSLQILRKNPWLFAIGAMLLPMVLVLASGQYLEIGHQALALIAVGASLLIIGAYRLLIRPEISGPVVFYIMFRCMNVQLSGAFFYFYTDGVQEYPEGPHFSTLFYATVITSVAIAGRMCGYMTAKVVFGDWHYARALYFSMPLAACMQLLFVPLMLRWNLTIGISDRVWCLTVTFLDMAARGWRHFPFSVMLLQATPKGLEASTLALNTGAANMGITLSVFFGSYILNSMKVAPAGHAGESREFDGFWKAQVVAALLPLLVLPFLPMLMPRRSQNDTLILENPESATHGAPVDRFMLSMTS